MSLINPYNLLGVTIKSNLNELKKSYYNLSLICHPDKGGSKDDMIILSKAYSYVKKQLSNINTEKTYEDLEKEFEDFCKDQENKPPTFAKIYEETNDLIKEFNKEFNNIKDFNPFNDGYGNLMEKSEINETKKYIDKENKDVKNQFNKIIEYEEPQSLPNDHTFYPLNKEKIEDFSLKTNNFEMTDYIKAFSKQNKIDITIEKNNLEKKYIEELQKRGYKD